MDLEEAAHALAAGSTIGEVARGEGVVEVLEGDVGAEARAQLGEQDGEGRQAARTVAQDGAQRRCEAPALRQGEVERAGKRQHSGKRKLAVEHGEAEKEEKRERAVPPGTAQVLETGEERENEEPGPDAIRHGVPLRVEHIVRHQERAIDRGEAGAGEAREIAVGEHQSRSAHDGRGHHDLRFSGARAEHIDEEREEARKIALVGVEVGVRGGVRIEGFVGDAQRIREIEMKEIEGMPVDGEGFVGIRDIRRAVPGEEQPGIIDDVEKGECQLPTPLGAEPGGRHGACRGGDESAPKDPVELPSRRRGAKTALRTSQSTAARPRRPMAIRETKKSSLARLT